MAQCFTRTPEDAADQKLLDGGWEFAGISLFWHPQVHHKFFTKKEAIVSGLGSDAKSDYDKMYSFIENLIDCSKHVGQKHIATQAQKLIDNLGDGI